MSQQTLPCTPPPQNCRGWVHFFRIGVPKGAKGVPSVPKKMSSKESLCFSELLRLKDPKTWFFTIFTQIKFW